MLGLLIPDATTTCDNDDESGLNYLGCSTVMTRHSLAEILLMVLAVGGAVAIFSLIGSRLVHFTSQGSAAGAGGIGLTVGGISAVLFSVLIVVVVAIAVALAVALRSKR